MLALYIPVIKQEQICYTLALSSISQWGFKIQRKFRTCSIKSTTFTKLRNWGGFLNYPHFQTICLQVRNSYVILKEQSDKKLKQTPKCKTKQFVELVLILLQKITECMTSNTHKTKILKYISKLPTQLVFKSKKQLYYTKNRKKEKPVQHHLYQSHLQTGFHKSQPLQHQHHFCQT